MQESKTLLFGLGEFLIKSLDKFNDFMFSINDRYINPPYTVSKKTRKGGARVLAKNYFPKRASRQKMYKRSRIASRKQAKK